jgi:hypothetical protein
MVEDFAPTGKKSGQWWVQVEVGIEGDTLKGVQRAWFQRGDGSTEVNQGPRFSYT